MALKTWVKDAAEVPAYKLYDRSSGKSNIPLRESTTVRRNCAPCKTIGSLTLTLTLYLKAASYGGYGQRGQNLYFNGILVFHVQGSIALHTPHSITTSQPRPGAPYHHFGRSGKASACWLWPFSCSVENASVILRVHTCTRQNSGSRPSCLRIPSADGDCTLRQLSKFASLGQPKHTVLNLRLLKDESLLASTAVLTMEKLRSYTIPALSWRSKYGELAQSADNEHDVCPSCGHVQNRAPQALNSSSTRSWLALWTIATVLFGVLIVSILLLAKQYTFHCSCADESSCPSSTSLLSDQAFPYSALKSGRRYRE